MKIVFAASELGPFAETGGLAEAVSSLAHALVRQGHEVKAFLPLYQSVKESGLKIEKVKEPFLVPMHQGLEHGSLYKTTAGEIEIFFIGQNFYYNRPYLYGDSRGDYDDNDRRFIFFDRGVFEALKLLKYSPDIIHGHDWQAGLIPAYLKTVYQNEPLFKKTRSIFTVHNAAYQGNFEMESFHVAGIPWDEFRWDRIEYHGQMSFLKAGLTYADFLTTVSEEYAREIQTSTQGYGMEGAFIARQNSLRGILNGIDPHQWDPARDGELKTHFSSKDLKGKSSLKAAFQKKLKFGVNGKIPLIGLVSRLTAQKGIDLILSAAPQLKKLKAQFVLLGSGDASLEARLKKISGKDTGNLRSFIKFDPALAKQIFAASDAYLMPSHFEPCGLAQMIAMRYGTVPIVRATGGLKETVKNFNEETGEGNGIVFENYAPEALLEAVKRTLDLFQKPAAWARIQSNCFQSDFSWAKQAKKYVEIYKQVLNK